MVEVNVFHNGSTNLPLKVTESGDVIPDATVAEVQQNNKEIVTDQIRHAVKAEEAGFDRVFFTEHHFEPSAVEFSTNPMMSQMMVAALTDEIRLCQGSNIINWHDPIRFAEQAALLDIASEGRVEIGIGRGYQPRENEVLGQYWGGTAQDQEKNRVSFEEKFDLIRTAWTEDMVSYSGEYHNIPPKHTKHHHEMDRAYFEDEVTENSLSEVMDWKSEGDAYSDLWSDVVSGGSTLRKLMVTPQPVQEPYPQIWMPTGSQRSISYAAQNAINGIFFIIPNHMMEKSIEVYYEAAEAAGWPDPRPEFDGEPLRYGWDEEKGRGVNVVRYVFNTEIADEETFERWKMGLRHQWQHYKSFGFVSTVVGTGEDKEDLEAAIERGEMTEADVFIEQGAAVAGDSEAITDQIAKIKEDLDYDDFTFTAWFDMGGLTGEETDKQLQHFGETVIPYLEEQYPSP
jgi:alkanesulfonate monooxygenase SsuD/methylene tetrahydromethanopterin reductase-like flavin-dependent oxidoreductase (luciferase family)